MKRLPIQLVLAIALLGWSGAARGGPWTSYLRAYAYTGMLASRDTVWCATHEAGLLRYDAARQRFDSFTREPGGLASNHLTALAADRSGRLWAGTQGKGVSRLAPDRQSWDLLSGFDGIPSDTITVLEARGDTVYIGTSNGIALWDGNAVAGAIPDGVNPSPFASNYISGVAQFGDSVWVATLAGIYVARLSDVPLSWSSVNQGLISTKIEGLVTDGEALIAFGNTVPYIFHFETGVWGFAGSFGTIGNVVRLSDVNGIVIASTRQGIYRWNPALGPVAGLNGDWDPVQVGPQYASSTYPDSLMAVYAVAVDTATNVAYAGNLDGVHVLTPGCTQCPIEFPPGPPGNNIINLALQHDANGTRTYVHTYVEGVGRFDGTTWRDWLPITCTGTGCDTTFGYPIYTFGLLIDRAGKKWSACWSGPLEEWDDSQNPPSFIHHLEALNDPIPAPERHTFGWATALDPDGGHWFGLETNSATTPSTPLGLDYYDVSGAFVRNFRPDSVPEMRGSQIRGLAVDHRGRFWVGYTGQGLQYFDWAQVPKAGVQFGPPVFNTVTGTETFYIQSLALNGDSLWVLTTRDLRRYDARTAKPVTNAVFTPPGATAQNAIRPLEIGPDGAVWLGTESGLRIYHPGVSVPEDFSTANSPLAGDEVRAIAVDQRTGVAWIGTSGGLNRYDPFYVPPAIGNATGLTVKVYPNPMALTGIGTLLVLTGSSDVYDGEVYDLNGRVVRRFSGIRNGQVFWNGMDEKGQIVKPGVYFVRAVSRGHTATARVALVR